MKMDQESIEQLNEEALERFQEWAIETQDDLEIKGTTYRSPIIEDTIWF
jgi:hypothetical protein